MNIISIILISIGLSADACAVALCKGLSFEKKDIKKSIIVGTYFGIFQACMPLIGYLLSCSFHNYIEAYNHWISFILLSIIGIHMIRESKDNSCVGIKNTINFKEMTTLAIATSIDALIIGITFSLAHIEIIESMFIIGIVTFVLSTLASYFGSKLASIIGNKCSILGGSILIFMGIKILLEHIHFI